MFAVAIGDANGVTTTVSPATFRVSFESAACGTSFFDDSGDVTFDDLPDEDVPAGCCCSNAAAAASLLELVGRPRGFGVGVVCGTAAATADAVSVFGETTLAAGLLDLLADADSPERSLLLP